MTEESMKLPDWNTGPMQECDEVCWICFDGRREDDMLCQPCACPRKVHPQCMARWQLQQAGRAEERHCRFCGGQLADWKVSLTPASLKPVVDTVQPIMVVYMDGEIHRIPVRQGADGLKEFTERIRTLYRLPEDVDIALTFGCKEPTSGAHLKLEGTGAFDAAVHCASVAAAERQQRAAANGTSGQGDSSDEGETADLLQSTLGSPVQLPPSRSRSLPGQASAGGPAPARLPAPQRAVHTGSTPLDATARDAPAPVEPAGYTGAPRSASAPGYTDFLPSELSGPSPFASRALQGGAQRGVYRSISAGRDVAGSAENSAGSGSGGSTAGGDDAHARMCRSQSHTQTVAQTLGSSPESPPAHGLLQRLRNAASRGGAGRSRGHARAHSTAAALEISLPSPHGSVTVGHQGPPGAQGLMLPLSPGAGLDSLGGPHSSHRRRGSKLDSVLNFLGIKAPPPAQVTSGSLPPSPTSGTAQA